MDQNNSQNGTFKNPMAAYSSLLPPNTTGSSLDKLKSILINYWGVSPQLVAQTPPGTLAFIGTIAAYNYQQASNGQALQNIDAGNAVWAYQQASQDPNIQAQFTDALALDKSSTVAQLNYQNTVNTVQQAQNAAQFRQQQVALAQANATAGIADSGFAKQAKQDLSTEQQGVIQSANAQNRKNVQALGAGLESTYGTNGLGQFGPLNIGGQVYNPATGVYGTQPVSQYNATEAAAQKYYGEIQYPGSQGSSAANNPHQ